MLMENFLTRLALACAFVGAVIFILGLIWGSHLPPLTAFSLAVGGACFMGLGLLFGLGALISDSVNK